MTNEENIVLTRRKHLYVIDNNNGTLNVNKRAIAYSNQKYIYYIVPGDDALWCIDTSSIREEPRTDDEYFAEMGHYEGARRYFWHIPEDFDVTSKKVLNEVMLTCFEHEAERWKKSYNLYKERMDYAQHKYNDAMTDVQEFKSKMKEDG